MIENKEVSAPGSLSGDGLFPAHIYEICLFDGEYKDYLLHTLPRHSEQSLVVSDRNFQNLDSLCSYLHTFHSLDLLLIDISEFEYLEHIKNHKQLRIALQYFYDCLKVLAQKGTTCLVFVNFPFYRQIHETPFLPDCIQLQLYPSDVLYFWEAEIANPPEWCGQKALFRPYHEEPPFLPLQ